MFTESKNVTIFSEYDVHTLYKEFNNLDIDSPYKEVIYDISVVSLNFITSDASFIFHK